jgi:7-keto-8-aminopelargonate synthetase-like enzyme
MMSGAGERRRQELRRNLTQFADEMPALLAGGKKLQSAIVPIIIGQPDAAVEAAQVLAQKGYFVPAIRFPTVARDAARLRVTLSARHTPKQISGLCTVLRRMVG